MGGGTSRALSITWPIYGLSPRGRGNPQDTCHGKLNDRSIPAWAGEPPSSAPRAGVGRVYPRVGGGTNEVKAISATVNGLSPRGRGNQGRGLVDRWFQRSIPAWAGEPLEHVVEANGVEVYPRVGGGTDVYEACTYRLSGLSPRGRGNHMLPIG